MLRKLISLHGLLKNFISREFYFFQMVFIVPMRSKMLIACAYVLVGCLKDAQITQSQLKSVQSRCKLTSVHCHKSVSRNTRRGDILLAFHRL